MKKAKGQTVAIVVLILLASLMLNLWLMLSMDYKQNFDRYHNKLNAEHVTVTVDDADGDVSDFLFKTLSNDNRVSQFGLNSCLRAVGSFPFNGGELSSHIVFIEKQIGVTSEIGKAEIVEEGNLTSGIYMPMIYKNDEIKVGESIEISVGNHSVKYTICGFFNSVMMGSHNCGSIQILLTQDKYYELKTLDYAYEGTLCSVRLNDISTNLNFESELKGMISKAFPDIFMLSNCYDMVSQSRYISQGICSIIMSVMAFLILLIALVIIISNINNYIKANIKNLGALKAIGYTSKQLICSLMVQFLGLTAIATIVGSAFSYCIFPGINSMMISQTGIPYAIRFLPIPILISLAILICAVAFAVWFATRRIKKIEPIIALRSGVQTHNFKRNHFPLEKTKAPLNLALALKTTFSSIKQNLTVCVTMIVLSIVVVFSGVMTANVIFDSRQFVDILAGEMADSAIGVWAEAEDDVLRAINSDERVEKVYLNTSANISHPGGADLMATISDDFSMFNNQDIVFKGRFPKYDNEIAIAAKYAKEKGFSIGNEIEISSNGKVQKYLICGFTQCTNYLGRDCLLTRQGYDKLGVLKSLGYYINLTDGTDIDAFNEEIKEAFNDDVNSAVNVQKIINAGSGVYISLIKIIVIGILVLSAIVIAFVLYLLVRTLLNNKKVDYGILKALGFTTKQLILQTVLSFMPAIIISTVFGLIVGCIIINPLLSIFLGTIGIVKCTFTVPVGFIAVAGLGLIVVSFLVACLLSLKVKKIAPRALLVGE